MFIFLNLKCDKKIVTEFINSQIYVIKKHFDEKNKKIKLLIIMQTVQRNKKETKNIFYIIYRVNYLGWVKIKK